MANSLTTDCRRTIAYERLVFGRRGRQTAGMTGSYMEVIDGLNEQSQEGEERERERMQGEGGKEREGVREILPLRVFREVRL